MAVLTKWLFVLSYNFSNGVALIAPKIAVFIPLQWWSTSPERLIRPSVWPNQFRKDFI